MSATKVVNITLKCDKCGVEFIPYEPHASMAAVRRIARGWGWSTGKKDYCHRCNNPEASK